MSETGTNYWQVKTACQFLELWEWKERSSIDTQFSKDVYYGYLVKGDLKGALRYIKQFREQEDLFNQYSAIFEQEQYISYPVDAELNHILRIYQQYYNEVFFQGVEKGSAEENLRTRLADFFGIQDRCIELSHIEENQIFKAFQLRGFTFMGGKTSGYYGPYIWRYGETRKYSVSLPMGTQEFEVALLDGFLTKSWIDYLSFGEISTGGWTDGDGMIHCIKSSYDFESESFAVSLLKHEAQHARDLSEYEGISSEDLEYRAKLVELIYSEERNLLEQFAHEADHSDKLNGHSLASGRIISEFSKKLHTSPSQLSIPQIRSIAKVLFEESEREFQHNIKQTAAP